MEKTFEIKSSHQPDPPSPPPNCVPQCPYRVLHPTEGATPQRGAKLSTVFEVKGSMEALPPPRCDEQLALVH